MILFSFLAPYVVVTYSDILSSKNEDSCLDWHGLTCVICKRVKKTKQNWKWRIVKLEFPISYSWVVSPFSVSYNQKLNERELREEKILMKNIDSNGEDEFLFDGSDFCWSKLFPSCLPLNYLRFHWVFYFSPLSRMASEVKMFAYPHADLIYLYFLLWLQGKQNKVTQQKIESRLFFVVIARGINRDEIKAI